MCLLLSVSHITDQDYGFCFDNSNLQVVDVNNLQIVGKKIVGLYRLHSSINPLPSSNSHLLQFLHGSYALIPQEDPHVWHACFGHLNYDSFQKLYSSQMVHKHSHFNVSNISCVLVYMGSTTTNLFSLTLLIMPHPFWS